MEPSLPLPVGVARRLPLLGARHLASGLPLAREAGVRLAIRVNGVPAPQGSKRHVGGGRMVEMSKAVGPWREAVRAEAQRARGDRPPACGPVSVRLAFLLPRPRLHYGTGRNKDRVKDSAPERPTGRPDLDKLVRAVLDGLTAGGVWADDSQVWDIRAWKVYADTTPPGVMIEVEQE